eukprot:scaffold22701_cov123-Cylindrotheca_fusiformis.AAC.15
MEYHGGESMKVHRTNDHTNDKLSSSEHSTCTREMVAQSDKLSIQQPTEFDVLFGRGKPYQDHPGNLRLHSIVNVYKKSYSQARRHEKTALAEEVVAIIKNNGKNSGRFLKRSDSQGCWKEVSDNAARAKVSHALRGKVSRNSSTQEKVVHASPQEIKSEQAASDPLPRGNRGEMLPRMSPLESLIPQNQTSILPPFSSGLSSSSLGIAPTLPFPYQSLLLNNIRVEREQLLLHQLAAGGLHHSSMRQPPASYYQNATRLLEAIRTNQNPADGQRSSSIGRLDPSRGPWGC